MTEREYIIVTSLARLRIARDAIAGAIYPTDDPVTDIPALRAACGTVEDAIHALEKVAEVDVPDEE